MQACVAIWCTGAAELVDNYDIHKVKVEAVAFSPDENFLISLGGQDDRR